jgi:hypothetical protein
LKFIVHYEDINVYSIKGFKKLYGQTLIESHCLLKNGEGNKNYILITEDYFEADQAVSVLSSSNWEYTTCSSQCFSGLRKIGYSFFNYSSNKALKDYHADSVDMNTAGLGKRHAFE